MVTGSTRLIVVNKGLAKKETCGWQNTDLTTLTHWHIDTGVKLTLTATGSNNMTYLQTMQCLSLAGLLWARSNAGIWEGLYKCVGATFPGQKRVALGKAPNLLEKHLDGVVHESKEETGETGLN